jgi:hypothetical protein
MFDHRVNFLEKLTELYPAAQDIYDDWTKDDDEGSEILWVLIYGFIGREIGNSFEAFIENDAKQIFGLIEKGACSENEDLKAAVLTGLLESMTDPLMEDREVWKQAQEVLGENSLKHMLAMNTFYGIE